VTSPLIIAFAANLSADFNHKFSSHSLCHPLNQKYVIIASFHTSLSLNHFPSFSYFVILFHFKSALCVTFIHLSGVVSFFSIHQTFSISVFHLKYDIENS